jgi:hypothetical protein
MTVKPFQGVLVGIVLFLLSFGVLYWNEGRTNYAQIAKRAVVVDANNVAASPDAAGQLISATGKVAAEPVIGDELYLKPGPYVKVERQVEVMAWVETTENVTHTNADGSQSSETNYLYKTDWVDEPADSTKFHVSEGHANIASKISDATTVANTAKVGELAFDPESIRVPSTVTLQLNESMVSLTENATLLAGEYVYVRESAAGTSTDPDIGDLRISYHVVKVPFDGTIFGQLSGTTVNPYVNKHGDELYRVVEGTHEQGIAQMRAEYKGALWAFRLIGFLMMWFGLWALFGPISALMSFIPVIGGVGKAFISVITFAVAFVLSAVAIIVFAILHNIWAVIVVCILILLGVLGSGAVITKRRTAEQVAK